MHLRKLPFLVVSAALLLAACQSDQTDVVIDASADLPQGIALLETVARDDGDDIVIPYRKFQLENGLTVVLHEDNSDPLVHVDVTYHVGSGREEVGKSGFAHFFEHMMFQGSENVADEQHFKIVTDSGGTVNGTTNTDRTNYFETVPSNQLEKMLWLEADRMGYFLDAVTQEKFEVQRDTVKNERGQSYDNRPYGRLIERVNEALYPEGHPYSWQTIGYIEDLNRVNVNDLKKFFLRWYGPNNATLTIGGRFDETEVLAWVDKYFAPIPRGPEVAMPEKLPVNLDANRYVSMEDNVALPLVYIAFPTVHAYHEDEAPLDVLSSILGQGETSLLYKNMVKNQLAVQAGAGHACAELACSFTLYSVASPPSGATLTDLEKIARDSLLEFEERGVLDDDLTRVKMSIVSGMIFGLESVAGKVGRLAAYETFVNNPNYTATHIADYESVTKEDVMRVYRKYIQGKPAVIMSIVPNGQLANVAHEDTWVRSERQLPEYEVLSEADLDFRRAADTFDRSIMPAEGENPRVIMPAIWRGELENGVAVLGANNAETPTTAIRLNIEAGQRHEPLEKLGLASITAAMLSESTTESSNEEISNRLQKLGSSVNFGAGDTQTTMTLRSLSENLDETLEIAAEMLLQPKFDPADFERVRSQLLQLIEHNKKEASVTARQTYQLLLFGKENSFAHSDIGNETTLAGITLDDVKAFYAEHYSPRIAEIIAVSDYSQSELLQKLSVLETWRGAEVAEAELQDFPDLGKTKIYLVDKPGAAQSEVRIGKRAMKYDATGEYYRAGLMNFALGGAFNSRINLNLREDKAYTYGARSFFSGNKDFGAYTASGAIRTDATADSIVQFENEIRGYADGGISEDELLFTRRALGQRDARRYETPSQKLGFLSRILEYGLDVDFVDQQNEILESIGAEELNELAQKHLTMDDMVIVIVGDKDVILPQIEELGYDIVELDAEGNELPI
jgi:zinc protease